MFATTRRDKRGFILPLTAAEVAERFWARVEKSESGCWAWKGARFRNGYGSTPWRGTASLAHRVAWRLAKGEIPGALLVCHRCDVRDCVNPDHLFLGTHSDNSRDMHAKGRAAPGQYIGPRAPRGENHYLAKLTADTVREIRELAATGTPQRALAERFKISRSALREAISQRSWKHVQ